MKTKKLPIRKCVGCNEGKAKRDLVRIVKNKEGDIFVDTTGKANGRGVYICPSVECFEIAKKSKKLNRSLKSDIPKKVYDNLVEVLKNNG